MKLLLRPSNRVKDLLRMTNLNTIFDTCMRMRRTQSFLSFV